MIYAEKVKLRKAKDQLFLKQKLEKAHCNHLQGTDKLSGSVFNNEMDEEIEVEIEVCKKCGVTLNEI